MICAECDREILDGGVICPRCNEIEPRSGGDVSYRDLAGTVRRLKGLVLGSLVFGILVAPFAVWTSSKALNQYHALKTDDAALRRQIVTLRWVAIGLLLFWALWLGAEFGSFL